MNNYNEIISMIGTIAVINLIAIILQGTKKILRKGEGKSNLRVAINLGIIGGLFGIYATINGYTNSNGAVIAIRDVGPMMAGCLAGPIGGIIAGLIAGMHRLIQGINNLPLGTTIPCSISTVLIGMLCGLLFKPFESKKSRGVFAFFIAILMECLHLSVVFIYMWFTENLSTSWNLILNVAPSFLFSNALAFGLMIFTTDMIDKYKNIEKNKDAIEIELKTATNIQKSMLPAILPYFPGRNEFEIFANMIPAKQVGGDFYDFYFIDQDHFAFLISDVSGKGVPSALFMVISKTIIKTNLQLGLSFEEAIEKTNTQLFEGNKESMFVTSWIGVLEISTGKVEFINAGHNYPILKKSNNEICFLKNRSGFILAGKKDSKYNSFNIKLEKGDMLFLYTDGITETINLSKEQYGEERLKNLLLNESNKSIEDICKDVKKDIDSFSNNSEQFDDITMVCLKYNGLDVISNKSINGSFEAKTDKIEDVTNFINKLIAECKVETKTRAEINIIIDEIFGNIAKYAYNKTEGKVEVSAFLTKNPLSLNIIFEDRGIPYNPLNAKEINKNISVNDRKYGGLGIGIVKKISDKIEYEFTNGKNKLMIKKILE